MKIAALVFGMLACVKLSCADDPPILSVCEALQNRLAYNGKAVIVVGRFAEGMEGAWLGEDCDGRLLIDGYGWPNDISLTYVIDREAPAPALPTAFQWSRAAIVPKLPRGTDTAKLHDEPGCGYRTAWAAVFGRFETKEKFQIIRYSGGELRGVGFGHLGSSPAQLIGPDQERFCLVSDQDQLEPVRDLARALWLNLKQVLADADGAAYFEASMKDVLGPGGAGGVRMLKGTIISSTPRESPNVLVLGMADREAPEVTLELTAGLPKAVRAGTEVEFEGVATEFAKEPFMVTFKVSLDGLVLKEQGRK